MGLYTRIIDLQKLQEAWKRVRKNKPAAGVDNVTVEQYDENLRAELKKLQMELQEHTYSTLPVRQVVLYKGEKARKIALYSMRDKVVQQSCSQELTKLFDPLFSTQTYAYRNSKSALNAVEEINQFISERKCGWILKMDITHFFDEIRWEQLKVALTKKITEDDVIDLIEQNCRSVLLDETTGELIEKRIGIYQGSALSPILSNIYMMDFDKWITENSSFFARYSDDMVVIGEEKESLQNLLVEISKRLETLGLRLNEKKTYLRSLQDGADFLGYHFDSSGKSIPAKAEENLHERLETMWLTSSGFDIKDKLKKAQEITGGWEQYFREEREIGSIFEFAALVYSSGYSSERLEVLKTQRSKLENVYRDITLYLAEIWRNDHDRELELLEYEQYYQVISIRDVENSSFSEASIDKLLQDYRSFIIFETAETAIELMQDYTDLYQFEKAAFWMKKKETIEKSIVYRDEPIIPRNRSSQEDVSFTQKTPAKIMKLFVGREDIYSKEVIGSGKKRLSELQTQPLTEALLNGHLKGNVTLGTYIQRPNSTVHYIVFDVDISRKIILQHDKKSDEFETYLQKARHTAVSIMKLLDNMGLKGYLEYSGYRGYHVWLLFTEWIPVRYANMFCEVIEAKINGDEDISIEYFPNRTRLKDGKFGQTIKLPFGFHLKTGERSLFLDEEGTPVLLVDPFLDNVARFSCSAIKKVLAANTGITESDETIEVDKDLSAFGDLDAGINEILSECSLMRYLCQKAVKTSYLTHFERLSILYVFGHIGEAGQQFVHQVMSHTLNYNFNTTEKFIRRCPEKPVSCVKLRDQYRKLTAEIGCNCVFKRTKNCYPSPVLHAISLVNDDKAEITLPTSRAMTKAKEKQVMDEINIHKKAQNLAAEILKLKKQKRSIDSDIKKIEKELQQLFDNAGIDCLEVEMGLLVRRKKNDGTWEWIIEI